MKTQSDMNATTRTEHVKDKPESRESVSRFLRNLALMMETGIPILRAFEVLAREEPDPKMKELIELMAFDLEIGKTMKTLANKYIGVFNAIHRSVLVAADDARLTEAVERISSIAEAEAEAKRKLFYSLLYPMTMVGFALFLLVATPSAMASRFDGVYQASESPHVLFLFLLHLSETFYNPWTYVVLGVLGLVAFRYRHLWRRPGFILGAYRFAYMIPPVARFLDAVMMERVCRVLALQIECGVPLFEAINRLEIVVEDPCFHQKILHVYRAVKNGEEFEKAVLDAKFLDKAFPTVVRVGVETACLDKLLDAWADDKKLEIEASIQAMDAALGPLAMLVAGALTAIWIMVMLSPLKGLVESL